ncbi:MAG: TIM barrel protein [Oscillospiraceae bacterium]|nr:TIM barrel protein [Oscillospiraceae bacterium]
MKESQLSIGNYTYPLHSFDYFLNSMERMGVKQIELWAADPHLYFADYTLTQVEALGKKIKDHGISVSCVTPEQCDYPINICASNKNERRRSIDYFKRAIEVAEVLGAPKAFVTSGRHVHDEGREEAYLRELDSLKELVNYAKYKGIYLVIEVNPFELEVPNDAKGLRKLLDDVDGGDWLLPVWDIDCAARSGEWGEDYIRLFGNKIGNVHFSDGVCEHFKGHIVPGDGKLPLTRCLEELDAAGYENTIAVEIMNSRYDADPDTAIQRTLDWFHDYMKNH